MAAGSLAARFLLSVDNRIEAQSTAITRPRRINQTPRTVVLGRQLRTTHAGHAHLWVRRGGGIESLEPFARGPAGQARAHFREIQNFFLLERGGERGMKGDGAMSKHDNLRLESWPLDRLIPSPRNARIHSPAQVSEIAGSIRVFGFLFSLVQRATSLPVMVGLLLLANWA